MKNIQSLMVHTFLGKAAEYAVAAQLLARKVNVLIPCVDEGYDLATPRRCRIQVKSTRLRTTSSVVDTYPNGVYAFTLTRRSNYSPTAKRRAETIRFSDRCDVVVFWGVDQNRFWVAPSHLVDNVYGIYLGPDSSRAFESEMEEINKMLKRGLNQREIGEKLGLNPSTISTRIKRAGTPMHQDTASYKVRQCENAWHYILDFDPANRIEQQTSNLRLVEPVAVNESN